VYLNAFTASSVPALQPQSSAHKPLFFLFNLAQIGTNASNMVCCRPACPLGKLARDGVVKSRMLSVNYLFLHFAVV
jgi:hypothetical protein